MAGEALQNKRIVPFPEAGEEVVIFLRNQDLAEFEKEAGEDYLFSSNERLEKLDPKFIAVCLKCMVKSIHNYEPYTIPEEVLNRIPLGVLRERLLDGISFTVAGKPFKEIVDESIARMKKIAEELQGDGGAKPPLESPAGATSTS